MSKARITVTLPPELLARIDRLARRGGASRSSVVARWLGEGARAEASRALERSTVDYYRSLDETEAREGEAIAGALSEAARRVDYGDGKTRSRRRRR